MITRHDFTDEILSILSNEFPGLSEVIFDASELIQYLNIKTRSASRGSTARGSFANHYAIYVLVEDYINRGFDENNEYGAYEGARFSDLLKRQRELPFGSKLQNHALNHRLNQEFRRYFRTSDYVPILRDAETHRYWINENLINIPIGDAVYNIASAVIRIIDAYVATKRDAFETFISDCERLQRIQKNRPGEVREFIASLLRPNVDARIFEIVSYAILKPYYGVQLLYWGWTLDDIHTEELTLYKTGRTNANDGGIDFVMRPLGRFFQVTESIDVRKYFLDIDKVQRYPITFVVKSEESIARIENHLRNQAQISYGVATVVNRYMASIEELLNIPILMERFGEVVANGKLGEVVEEIVTQTRLEFNLPTE